MNKGRLLVAHPSLEGTLFDRSVIYVYQDNQHGSAGLILNKVSEFSLAYLFDSKGLGFGKNGHVYIGGPIETRNISLLHTDDFSSQNTKHIENGICISSDNLMLEKIAMDNEPRQWRMTLGICGWSPMQLAMEMASNDNRKKSSWLTIDADASIIFDYDGEKQWEKAVELCSTKMFDEYF